MLWDNGQKQKYQGLKYFKIPITHIRGAEGSTPKTFDAKDVEGWLGVGRGVRCGIKYWFPHTSVAFTVIDMAESNISAEFVLSQRGKRLLQRRRRVTSRRLRDLPVRRWARADAASVKTTCPVCLTINCDVAIVPCGHCVCSASVILSAEISLAVKCGALRWHVFDMTWSSENLSDSDTDSSTLSSPVFNRVMR